MAPILRAPGQHAKVVPIELFFDLVYVFAITQLSHLLLDHLTLAGAAQTLLLTLAVWWAWMYATWTTNYCDPDHPAMRLTLAAMMLAGLAMAAALPYAFGPRALWFAIAYVTLQLGRSAVVAIAARHTPHAHLFRLILLWHATAALLWITGALIGGTPHLLLWITALAIEYAAPWHGYRLPFLRRTTTTEWTINGAHMAERCQLFVILALGESILITGLTLANDDHLSAATLIAFTLAFLTSMAMWWLYFDTTAEAATHQITTSADPGRLARSAYTYAHIPIVAGIIVAAVGDELAIAHPLDPTTPATTLTILGGPALYLAGHATFHRTVFTTLPTSRLTAIAALAAAALAALLVPHLLPPLALATIATLILATLALHDRRASARRTAIPG